MEASPQLPAILPAPSCEVSVWFDREIRPHEPALRAYLRARFPALGDHEDIVQEAYIRLLRVRQSTELRSPKTLLFTIARNLAIDVFRHRQAVPHEPLANFSERTVLSAVAETKDPLREQKLQLLEEALQTLPERSRQVFLLKRFEGLSYEEISARLGIHPHTISKHMTIAMTRLRDRMRALTEKRKDD